MPTSPRKHSDYKLWVNGFIVQRTQISSRHRQNALAARARMHTLMAQPTKNPPAVPNDSTPEAPAPTEQDICQPIVWPTLYPSEAHSDINPPEQTKNQKRAALWGRLKMWD